jgi:fructose-specific component phosphotransferase system IIB-like protein
MAVNNFDNLKASVADWLNRGDLTGRIPDFITLAEAQIHRKLRRKTVRAALSIVATTGENTAIPATLAELRSIRIDTGTAASDIPIPIVTPEALNEWRRVFVAAGKPRAASVVGAELVIVPVPDITYATEIIYFQKYVALSDTATTNAELVEAPDMFLFGALAQAEPYLANDSRVPMWKAKFEEAINELNMVREREEYSAAMRKTNPPVAIGG